MSDLNEARRVLRIEAEAILNLVEKLDERFTQAVDLIMSCQGKLVITGIGKSGQIGRKISSTFSSTGTSSFFLHPAESSHGDLGMISENDVVLGISYGGEAGEMTSVLQYLARKNIPLLALTGNTESRLAKAAQVVVPLSIKEEACPLKLAPTSSSTVTLALGDALAMATMKRKGFQKDDFAEIHPGGRLGRRLLNRVSDLMHKDDALPVVDEDTHMTEVLSLMTGKEVRGVAGVVNKSRELVGIITDGDIRRRLEKSNKAFSETAKEIMSRSPKTIDANELAEKALFVMDQFRINRLFVVDKSSSNPQEPVGLLDFSDLLRAGIR